VLGIKLFRKHITPASAATISGGFFASQKNDAYGSPLEAIVMFLH
jgi:hypothetical protein